MTQVQLLIFEITGNQFAIDIQSVEEVIKYHQPAAAPGAISPISGIIDLRGLPVPVIDLHDLFSLPNKDQYQYSRIIIFENSGYILGLITTRILGVKPFDLDDFFDPPAGTNAEATPYTKSLGHHEEKILTLLDANQLCSLHHITTESING